MTLREQLKTLSNAVGVSGGEQDVRKLIIDAIKPHVEQITVDAMGNVTALRKGTGASSARVMLAAHMDEPGFMVTEIGDNGLISVNPVGPLDLRVLPTKRVLVGASKTPGVILWVPIHRSFGQNNLVEVDHLSIDVGADDKAGTGAKPGDRVAFVGDFAEFGRNLVRGKALDSRAACAALIELLSGDPFSFDLYVAFTAQQGIGGRGARVAAQRIKPQRVIVLQGADCNDLPRDEDKIEEDRAPKVRLGAGPALTLVDGTFVTDRSLVERLRHAAAANDIPYQIETQGTQNGARYGTEAYAMAQFGVSTATLSIPVRYMRGPNALLHVDDLDHTVRLLRATLTSKEWEQ